MDATTLRRMAARLLRLAQGTFDRDQAKALRLKAADYLERADEPAAQQPQRDDPPKKNPS